MSKPYIPSYAKPRITDRRADEAAAGFSKLGIAAVAAAARFRATGSKPARTNTGR